MPTPKTWTRRAAAILLDERNKRYLGMTDRPNPGASKDAPVTAAGRALLAQTDGLRGPWTPFRQEQLTNAILAIEAEAADLRVPRRVQP